MSQKLAKSEYEEYLYHNTEKLLKCYREVVWGIEVSLVQAQINFEIETDSKIEEFLGMSYSVGMDLSGTVIEEQVRTLERNKKMLNIIDSAVNAMRKKQTDGETYYWILYYTYFCEKQIDRVEEVVTCIGKHVEKMSWRTYFRKRKDAIDCLSNILWGFTSKECLPVLQEFVQKSSGTGLAQKKH